MSIDHVPKLFLDEIDGVLLLTNNIVERIDERLLVGITNLEVGHAVFKGLHGEILQAIHIEYWN